MARGIAVVFAYAGHRVSIVDVKARDDDGYAERCGRGHRRGARARWPRWPASACSRRRPVDGIAARVSVVREAERAGALREPP